MSRPPPHSREGGNPWLPLKHEDGSDGSPPPRGRRASSSNPSFPRRRESNAFAFSVLQVALEQREQPLPMPLRRGLVVDALPQREREPVLRAHVPLEPVVHARV